MTASLQEEKAALRKEALAKRDTLPPAERMAAAETIATRPFPIPVATGAIISGFSPLKTEINPLPLMRRLAKDGARLALPVVVGRGHPLTMRAWAFGAPLASGVWGIREPTPTPRRCFPTSCSFRLRLSTAAGTASAMAPAITT